MGKNTVFVNLAPAEFIPGSSRAGDFLVWLIKCGADGFCYRYQVTHLVSRSSGPIGLDSRLGNHF